jgi:hypothetical protein
MMMALYLSGVQFCRPWTPPPLEPWEEPFSDRTPRLPQAPDEAARRREARQRSQERQRRLRQQRSPGTDCAA